MLDENFAKFKHILRNHKVNLRNDLNGVEECNKKKLSKVRQYVNDIEDGQKFNEKEFEEQKEKIKDLKTNQTTDYTTKSKPHTKVRKKTK